MKYDDLPHYKSHKVVGALQVSSVDRGVSGGVLHFDDEENSSIDLPEEYFAKHRPFMGGYFVVYKDGYQSFSPQDAFEDGYTIE